MSADKCPVCGCAEPSSTGKGYKCGGETSWSDCEKASDLAIARAAEIERLRAALQRIADQGPHYGPDGTFKTWEHWIDIARNALTETKPQETP